MKKRWAEVFLIVFAVAALAVLAGTVGQFTVKAVSRGIEEDVDAIARHQLIHGVGHLHKATSDLDCAGATLLLDEFHNRNLQPVQSIAALNRLGPPAIPMLCAALEDPRPEVRLTAVRSLLCQSLFIGPLPDVLLQRLLVLIDDPAGDIRLAAVLLIGRVGKLDANSFPALIKALHVDDPQIDEDTVYVRQHIAHLLARIGPEARMAVAPLTRLLADPHPGVRRQAALALKRIDPGA